MRVVVRGGLSAQGASPLAAHGPAGKAGKAEGGEMPLILAIKDERS